MKTKVKCAHWEGDRQKRICDKDADVIVYLNNLPIAFGLCYEHEAIDAGPLGPVAEAKVVGPVTPVTITNEPRGEPDQSADAGKRELKEPSDQFVEPNKKVDETVEAIRLGKCTECLKQIRGTYYAYGGPVMSRSVVLCECCHSCTVCGEPLYGVWIIHGDRLYCESHAPSDGPSHTVRGTITQRKPEPSAEEKIVAGLESAADDLEAGTDPLRKPPEGWPFGCVNAVRTCKEAAELVMQTKTEKPVACMECEGVHEPSEPYGVASLRNLRHAQAIVRKYRAKARVKANPDPTRPDLGLDVQRIPEAGVPDAFKLKPEINQDPKQEAEPQQIMESRPDDPLTAPDIDFCETCARDIKTTGHDNNCPQHEIHRPGKPTECPDFDMGTRLSTEDIKEIDQLSIVCKSCKIIGGHNDDCPELKKQAVEAKKHCSCNVGPDGEVPPCCCPECKAKREAAESHGSLRGAEVRELRAEVERLEKRVQVDREVIGELQAELAKSEDQALEFHRIGTEQAEQIVQLEAEKDTLGEEAKILHEANRNLGALANGQDDTIKACRAEIAAANRQIEMILSDLKERSVEVDRLKERLRDHTEKLGPIQDKFPSLAGRPVGLIVSYERFAEVVDQTFHKIDGLEHEVQGHMHFIAGQKNELESASTRITEANEEISKLRGMCIALDKLVKEKDTALPIDKDAERRVGKLILALHKAAGVCTDVLKETGLDVLLADRE